MNSVGQSFSSSKSIRAINSPPSSETGSVVNPPSTDALLNNILMPCIELVPLPIPRPSGQSRSTALREINRSSSEGMNSISLES